MENKIPVDIYFSGLNFSAYVPLLPGCVATGDTPKEVNQHIKEAIEQHIKGSLEDGDEIPQAFYGQYELNYHFDAEGLLNYYKGIFTKTGLQRLTGINSKQLHHYASGTKKPRKAQIEKLESAFHELGRELMEVKIVAAMRWP
jgi:predicted RNase H-like HicB family nuclease